MKRLASNCALALASLAVALFLAESAVRWIYRDITTTTPIESWFGERWKDAHLTRYRGFRDRPFSRGKPPGERRIVIVGDSFTVAMGIPSEARYGERIEAALTAGGGPTRVVQLARPGQELDGHLATLRGEALSVGPDFVLLQFYVNDFEISKLARPHPRPPIAVGWLHALLYRRSAIYSVLTLQWNSAQLRWGLVEDYASYMGRRYGDPLGESRLAVAALRGFFDTCRERRIPVGMVLFPVLTPRAPAFDFLYDRVLEECETARVPCVDLRPVFGSDPEALPRLRLNRFDHHASALAHELAARALLDELGPSWFALPFRGWPLQ